MRARHTVQIRRRVGIADPFGTRADSSHCGGYNEKKILKYKGVVFIKETRTRIGSKVRTMRGYYIRSKKNFS